MIVLKMSRFALSGLALSLLVSACCAQEIRWAADLNAAKSEALKSGKPILLHFGAGWCRPCQEVETFVFRNPGVIRKLNDSVIPVRVDIDQSPQLAAEFGVKTLPTDVVITTSEKVIQKRNSPMEASGYVLMLDEIGRAQTALATAGEVALDEKQQLHERWSQGKSAPGEQLDLPAFDQQRPLAPAMPSAVVKAPETPRPSVTAPASAAPTASSSQFSPAAPPAQAVAAPPFTTEARVNSAAAAGPASASRESSSANQLMPAGSMTPAATSISNPFANSNSAMPVAEASPANSNSKVMLTSGMEFAAAVALDGDCPVTLLKETKWVKGNEQFGAVHRGRTYLFASAESQAEFLRDPDAYSPLLAGFDPVVFHEQGRLQDGKKAHGVFMTREGRQQVVLFENEETRAKFRSNPGVYLESIRVAVEQADGAAQAK